MKRFVFAGNRTFVFHELAQSEAEITHVFPVKDSYLQKEIEKTSYPFTVIESKRHLVESLKEKQFDVFLANGLPYILPIFELQQACNAQFVNIHPSHLPDLRGADPIPGAILFGRDSGATCHYMDDGIDTGDIISQIKIPYHNSWEVGLLYKLCFKAEVEVFRTAFANNFERSGPQVESGDEVYYSFKADDLKIDLEEDPEGIVRRVRAFNNPSKKCILEYNGSAYKINDVDLFENEYLESLFSKKNGLVVGYANGLLYRYESKKYLLFKLST